MFHKTARASLALTLAAGLAFAQTGNPPGIPRTTPAVQFDNSPRVHDLIRAGNLYLSLRDALALAIENNLDIELQRYLLPQGDSELLRTKGGGLTRGLNFTLAEVPTGTGGPLSPVLTTAAAAGRATAGSSVATSALGLNELDTPDHAADQHRQLRNQHAGYRHHAVQRRNPAGLRLRRAGRPEPQRHPRVAELAAHRL